MSNSTMLGHLRRTTRIDVALALTSAGIIYLAWVLATWAAKSVALALASAQTPAASALAGSLVNSFTSWGALVFDLAGPLWMVAGLWLVIRASRQRRVISWSWLLIAGQGLASILLAVWAAVAAREALWLAAAPVGEAPAADWAPVAVAVAVLIWVSTLVWLLLDRARLRRRPLVADASRTHAYRR